MTKNRATLLLWLSLALLPLLLLALLSCGVEEEAPQASPQVLREQAPADLDNYYRLRLESDLPHEDVYLPAMATCIMIEKYVEEMNCRFNGEGTFQGELSLMTEALLIDQVNETHLYGWSEPTQKQVVTPLYSLTFQCVVRKSSGIRSIGDLAGKKVAIGLYRSESMRLSQALLLAHGLKKEEVEWVYLDLAAAIKAMEEHRVDALAFHLTLPSPALAAMATNFDLLLLPLEQAELVDRLEEHFPGYESVTFAPQTYKGVDRYGMTAATTVMLVTERDTKMAITYEVARGLYEHMSEFKALFPLDKEIRANRLNKDFSVSWHQGAAKYFIERDLLWN